MPKYNKYGIAPLCVLATIAAPAKAEVTLTDYITGATPEAVALPEYNVTTDTAITNITVAGRTAGADLNVNIAENAKITAENSGNDGIVLNNGYNLNLQGTNSDGSNAQMSGFGTAIKSDGNLKIKDTAFSGNVNDVANTGELTLSGNNNFNAGITGSGATTIASGTTVSQVLKQKNLTVNDDATLKINAGKLSVDNAINNDGRIILGAGTNRNKITGNGTTEINGNVVLSAEVSQNMEVNSSKKLTANADYIKGNVKNNGTVTLNDGTLTKNIIGGTINIADFVIADKADYLQGKIKNTSQLYLNGGTLSQNISGIGSLLIGGDVIANSKITQEVQILNTQSGAASLTVAAGNLGGVVLNEGILNLNSGKLNHEIVGGGVTNINGDVSTAYNIDTDVNVNTGGSLNVGENQISLISLKNRGTIKMALSDISANSDVYSGGKIDIATGADLGGTLQLTIAADKLNKNERTGGLQLINARGYSGEFAETIANNRYTITSAGNGKYTVEYTQDAAEVIKEAGGTQNNINTGEAWDNVSGLSGSAEELRNVLNDLSQNDAKGYINALNKIAPSDNRLKVRVAAEINNMLDEEISRRQGRQGLTGAEVTGMWVQALGNYTKQDATDKANGFDAKTAGLALGAEGKVSDNTNVGIGYAFTRADADSDSGDTDVNSHTLFAYGKYQPSAWYIRGMASYSYGEYKEDGSVAGISNKAEYNINNIGLQAYTGYEMPNGITPEAGLRYLYVMPEDYTDDIGQKINQDNVNVLTAVASLKYSHGYTYGNALLTPKARLGVTYDVISDNNTADVAVGNVSYKINGERLERLGFEAGIELENKIGNWTMSAGYDLGLRKNYQSHAALLKAKYEFYKAPEKRNIPCDCPQYYYCY